MRICLGDQDCTLIYRAVKFNLHNLPVNLLGGISAKSDNCSDDWGLHVVFLVLDLFCPLRRTWLGFCYWS